MQVRVIKADGGIEDYLHNKVIGTINKTLEAVERADVQIAEDLAEVVTYFVHCRNRRDITSGEILFIIKAILCETGNEDAAVALSEHHFNRKLRRDRLEVVSYNGQRLADIPVDWEQGRPCCRWEKSMIVEDLVSQDGMSRQNARVIAASVEEKVLGLGVGQISTSLIKELVLSEARAFIRAERHLQSA